MHRIPADADPVGSHVPTHPFLRTTLLVPACASRDTSLIIALTGSPQVDARALNISHTTVSRALADSPKISVETKLRVRHAVEELGYVPSASAGMMRGARSSLIGLVVPDPQNDFYATVAKTVADALAARSMQLLLSVTDDDSERELRELRGLLETRPAGISIVPTAKPRPETVSLLKHVETVQLVRKQESLGANSVLIKDREGTFAATQHLITYGHKRIAFIGGDASLSTGRDRLAGFETALKEHGLVAAATALGTPRRTLRATPLRP